MTYRSGRSFIAGVFACVVLLSACALPPPDITRQNLVPEDEIEAVRYTKLGLGYMREGRYLDGEVAFYKALSIQPEAEPILTNIAVSLLMQERFDEALSLFMRLEKRDSGSLVYKLWVGRALIKNNRFVDGIQKLKSGRSLALDREDLVSAASFSRTISVAYFEEGLEESALCESSQAYIYTPVTEEVLRHARLLIALGFPQNAALLLQGHFGATTLPTIDAHLVFAEASLMLDDLPSAVDFMRDALFISSGDADTQYMVKLLTLIVGDRLKKDGIESDIRVLDSDLTREILSDDRLTGAGGLYFPAKLLKMIQEISRSL